jgi:alpha-tubulin suppressor-like RCC1 family protein
VWCWGYGTNGQLGNGNAQSSSHPQRVSNIDDAVEVVCGYDHACARHAGGQVSCWGSNSYGQLGNPNHVASQTAPTPVAQLSGAVQLAAGAQLTCALLQDDTVVCWGSNTYGQLGNGKPDDSDVPVLVTSP